MASYPQYKRKRTESEANRKKRKKQTICGKRLLFKLQANRKRGNKGKSSPPPFHLPPSDDDIIGAPGPKKKERVRSEFELTHKYLLFSFLYKL